MNKTDANNQEFIEDLTAANAEEIKGGQTREHILLTQQTQAGKKKKKPPVSGDANWDGVVSGSDF